MSVSYRERIALCVQALGFNPLGLGGDVEESPKSAEVKPEFCGKCDACRIAKHGCGCDGALDDGCFYCTPDRHTRPTCGSVDDSAPTSDPQDEQEPQGSEEADGTGEENS